jgi:AraC-like DNA-binding protein
VAEPALPDGSPELIFNFGAPFEHVMPDGRVHLQPRAFLVGQITRPMVVRPTGTVDLFAVRFESHGAALWHPTMSALTNTWCSLSALVGQPLTALETGLFAGATDSASTTSREQLIVSHLLVRVQSSHALDRRVATVVRAIRAHHGAVSLDDLVSRVGLTPRTMQRLFLRQVGVSPKLLCRIVRFQRIFAAWRADPSSLARVALECGYFDQSHLVRDFHDFAGAPPAGFLAELPAFTRLFLAT